MLPTQLAEPVAKNELFIQAIETFRALTPVGPNDRRSKL